MNLNKQTITYSFIIIFIIITFIHLYKINNNNNNKENFMDIMESQNLQGFDVFINSMSQVKFGNNSNKISLDTMMNEKVSKTELTNSISNLTTTVGGLSTNITNLMNTPSIPDYTIIECFDETIPVGWQLCDGMPLKTINNNFISIQREDNSGTYNLLTPNLMKNVLLNPPLSERYHNNSYGQGGSKLNYIYQDSSLDNTGESRWLCEFTKNPFMRIKLDKIYNVTGVWMQGHWGGSEVGRNVSILKVTGYNYPQLDIYTTDNNNFFRNENINTVDSSILVPPIIFKKNNTESIKGFDNSSEQFVSVMFDTPVKCNFLKIQPIKALSDTTYFNLRIGVIVKPVNKYLIKKPKQ